ncbi:hypothetical protein HBH92_022430 [Parastagonospora nodorum]|nr:hypothetical protein HBH92_022430 [Parastagonospora nodorum]KAH5326091.1 hypothetical protein HBI12_079970 [Parastagonospora nodorum]KAH6466012.1 hypothetical protein HBI57_036450 [Parastagonospora nodorum]
MSTWIQDCVKNHQGCSKPEKSFMPTRLLDVQAFRGSRDIKLVTLTGHDATSSYRPMITTAANLAINRRRISFYDLSLTFKDAVKLTIDLGERYLWIDSLCIVQDDPDDWLHEAGKMSAVYGNAIFTLSALSSSDSTQGCRVANPRAITHERRFFDFDSGPYRIRMFEKEIVKWHEEYGDDTYRHGEHGPNPLRGRAWTLQERELSTRNIFFSQNLHEVKPVDDFRPWSMRNVLGESVLPEGPVALRDRWYELMEDYMSRHLTQGSDKLPALGGLAQNFQKKLPSSDYLAGIWTEHLPHALLWRMTDASNAQRSTTYRAPSFSFLSLDGPMSYESQMLTNYGVGDRWEDDRRDFASTDLEFLSSSIELNGVDRFGAIRRASLAFRGRMLQVRLKLRDEEEDNVHQWNVLDTSDGSMSGAFFPDVGGEFLADTPAWCIAARPEPEESYIPIPYLISERLGPDAALVMGLALQRDDGNVDIFRRVGLIRWMKRSAFYGVKLTKFAMV